MTGTGGRPPLDDFTQDYRATLLRFLPRRDEAARESAYELGRRAFVAGISLLDVCRVHHELTLEVFGSAVAEDHVDILTKSGELLLDVLAAYDMTHRSVLGP
ncbi:phosphatase RsbU N-terminal domain-containing protein [Terrabacter carboxydivorans]|uniref:Phosphoserine phosphatase RsbU N-terminal domain-containing protein n=1 Tax=Terrabacter carboxydivorans TaxID=619730 RepID=A0ABN3KR29_9MICO